MKPMNRNFKVVRLALIGFTLFTTSSVLLADGRSIDDDSPLLTIAEKSDYKATSRHADVMEFCERLAKKSPLVRMNQLGLSTEGRAIPMLILADPPIASA